MMYIYINMIYMVDVLSMFRIGNFILGGRE